METTHGNAVKEATSSGDQPMNHQPLPRRQPPRRRLGRVGGAFTGIALAAAFAGCQVTAMPETPAVPAIPSSLARYVNIISDSADVTSNVVYGTANDYTGTPVDLTADVYTPSADSVTGRPLVIFVHGGGWSSGSKNDTYETNDASAFARSGYVAVSIDYRLRPAGTFDPTNWTSDPETSAAMTDARDDVQNAVRYFKTNAATYGIDPSKVVLVGRDGGATTALEANFHANDTADTSASVQGVVSIAGGSDTSAIDAGDAPFVEIHGDADTTTPITVAQATCDAATAAGVSNIMFTVSGADHDIDAFHAGEVRMEESSFILTTLAL